MTSRGSRARASRPSTRSGGRSGRTGDGAPTGRSGVAMKIVVVGAGALGGLVGAHLTEAGEDVILVEINEARVQAPERDRALHLRGQQGRALRAREGRHRRSTGLPSRPTWSSSSVKSYQTEDAVAARAAGHRARRPTCSRCRTASATPRSWPGSSGRERVLCGITYHSIQHTGPNRLRYRPGIKPIQIAPHDGEITPEIEAIGEVFRAAGLDTERRREHRRRDLAEAAAQRRRQPGLGADRSDLPRAARRRGPAGLHARRSAWRSSTVMRARGVPIVDEEDPYRPVIGSQKALGKNRPSMWQDLVRANRTEVDAINGAVVRRGGAARSEGPAELGPGAVHPLARAAEVPAQAGDRRHAAGGRPTQPASAATGGQRHASQAAADAARPRAAACPSAACRCRRRPS